MKNIFLVLLCIQFLNGCGQEKLTNKETVIRYFDARNAVDFEEVKRLINDSITVTEGDYVMPYSQDSYYEVFKWDSVFQTKYELVELQEIHEQIIVTIALTSIRNEFLQNSRMTCPFKISLESGKVSKIESLDCHDADWEVWQERVSSLVNWIEINHPELDGFIHDMTLTGARNYVKAIRLYEASKDDL